MRGDAGLSDRVHALALEYVAPAADEVDRDARFPKESIEALRSERLLSALVPANLGGGGARLSDIAAVVAELGRHCASTAMVFAMHQIQVACLVRHGDTAFLTDYVREEVVGGEALLASATTEVGIGGDVRSSSCAVEAGGGRFRLHKQAPVISYGQFADAILATARRCETSPPSDQVLVLCRRPHLSLEPISDWDTFGFRGTCSLGFELDADDVDDCILSDPYADISERTMLPVSHILWAHVWLGIADAAVSTARAHVRREARKKPGATPPAAVHLAELMAVYLPFRAVAEQVARHFDESEHGTDTLGSLAFAIECNSLKVAASTLVVDIVGRAMRICGMAGYREDSEFALGRLLRDAHGATLMVNNDRILANSAQMLLVAKEA
jgi:acyl-CoA dehydrogenase